VKKESIFLSSLVLITAMINLLNFNNNYHFGGDFAQYIIQSKLSISELEYEQNYNVYFNSFISETIGPNLYHSGYPILLKIVSSFDVHQIKYYKLVNITLSLIFIVICFLIFKNFDKKLMYFGTLLIAFSDEFIIISSSLEADVSFAIFGILIIYTLTNKTLNYKYELSMTYAFISCFFKMQGVLFVGFILFFYLLNSSKNKTFLIVFSTLCIISVALYFSEYKVLFGDYSNLQNAFSLKLINLKFNLQVIASFFLPKFLDLELYRNIFIFLFVIVYIFNVIKFKIFDFYNLFFTLFLVFFSSFIFRGGIRFTLFVIPVFIIIVYRALLEIKNVNFQHIVISLIFLINLTNLHNFDNFKMYNALYTKESEALFQWIETNTNDSDLISFYKPRTLRLITERNFIHTTFYEDKIFPDFVILLNNQLTVDGENSFNINTQRYKYSQNIADFYTVFYN